jgi:tRNA pseudouridine38-40 synthase
VSTEARDTPPGSIAGRLALGVAYRGQAYQGWQSQPGGATVQDVLETALARFVGRSTPTADRITTVCAGRTDAGVHGMNQVVHLDPPVERDRFVVLESPVRPALEAAQCGWVFRPLDGQAMRAAAALLLGTHDFSSFRSADCQSPTPVKTLRAIDIVFRGQPQAGYWRFDFDGNAFLHHMVRNVLGCLVAIGSGRQPPEWMAQVLAARSRAVAAPTFPPDGLYFVGPYYDAEHAIPAHTPAQDWIP